MEKIYSLQNITKKYQTGQKITYGANNINLDLYDNEIVTIIGSSGSGKSTLLNIASLLDTPDSGSIELKGEKVISEKQKTYMRAYNIGLIHQFHNLITDFSVLENVTIPLIIQNIPRERAEKQAQEILEELGIDKEYHDSFPKNLSGGEQQRVAIARAIVHNPQIILADEPTGSLDEKTGIKVFHVLQKIVKEKKIAMLLITHDMKLAKQTDRIFEIQNGNLVEIDDKKRNI